MKILLLLIALAAIYAAARYRSRLLHKDGPRLNFEDFEGDVYQIGESYVAKRKTDKKPKQTLVCIHGFMEDMRYFTELYDNPEIELILVTNSGYYCPFSTRDLIYPDWADDNPFPPYTIEYDAFVLAQVVQNIASTKKIRLHGHSRGGAVVLDAVRQTPKLLGKSELILEAALLPQGKALFGRPIKLPKIIEYLLPINMGLVSKIPFNWYSDSLLKPMTERKRVLLPGLWFNAKNHQVLIENVRSMADWAKKTDYSIYNNVEKGTFLIGQTDNVLDRKSMIESAERAHSGFNIELTENTTHFVSIEEPKYARTLAEQATVTKSPARRTRTKKEKAPKTPDETKVS